ncbi:MAG: alpha/beta hydrolase [Pseudomonadota bacterium]
MKDISAPTLDAPAALYWGEGITPPEDGKAIWLFPSDGVRLRAAVWPEGRRGTVVLFQGRTEFIEKYVEPIRRFRDMGFALATLDWRGQGLSERPLADRRKGHVGDFAEYQRDVDALLAHLADIQAPKPWILVAHSMGGGIAARALMRVNSGPSTQFAGAVLTAPMLEIFGSPGFLTASRAVSSLVGAVGMRKRYALGCDRKTAAEIGFRDNVLTSDAERFDRYARQVTGEDALALGGPTWGWLRAALRETARLEPTRTPMLICIGTDDTVVSTDAAHRFAADAERAQVAMLAKARHEPFLETDAVQEKLWSAIDAFLKDLEI